MLAQLRQGPLFYRSAAAPASIAAGRAAEKLSSESVEVLAWYAWRQSRPWVFWRRLSVKEKRLQGFLLRTVKPCLELVRAASARYEGDESVDMDVDPLRQDAAAGRLSYRALYNLACFEMGAGRSRRDKALSYLQEALREAPADRVEELSAWAAQDPALREVREEDEFEELIEQSQPMEARPPESTRVRMPEVLRLVSEHPGMTMRELAQKLSISERSAGVLLRMAMRESSPGRSVER